MKIPVILYLTLTDKNGKTILRKRLKSKSYLRAFIRWLLTHISAIAQSTLDTVNVSRSLSIANPFRADAGVAIISYGMVAGTGITPVALSDYKLETLIAHGTAAGQLSYGASLIEGYFETSPEYYFLTRRSLNNQSGGIVTVKEVGLYVTHNTFYFAAIRDLIPSIDVAAGQTLTIEYKIKIAL